jgi:hypothetical protein
LSAKTGAGMQQWLHWLLEQEAALEHRLGAITETTPGTGIAAP